MFTAVIVTVPLLVVDPAAIVSVLSALNVKSPFAAFVPAVADTVIVVAALDVPLNFAVTVVTPPSSEIDAGDRTKDTVGVPSSSVIVSVSSEGSDTPRPPLAEPETVTLLFGSSLLLFVAVIVTVPVLVVDPVAIVSVVVLDSVKSPATAFVPAVADTVIVVAALDVPLNFAVTVVTPPSSEIDVGDKVRDTVGAPSSSVIVSVALDGSDTPRPPLAEPDTVTLLFGSS